jgi:chromosomal replication initiator protein
MRQDAVSEAIRQIVDRAERDPTLSLESAQDLLTDYIDAIPRTSVREIQSTVAWRYGISRDDMLSDARAARLARPRQIAMYLARKLTTLSLPAIGRKFRRDHTTVLHAVRVIDAGVATDQGLQAHIKALLSQMPTHAEICRDASQRLAQKMRRVRGESDPALSGQLELVLGD